MADLEWGLLTSGALVNNDNTPVIADFVTGMVKGDSTNLYAIRAGDAQSGKLKTMHSGKQLKLPERGLSYFDLILAHNIKNVI
jgi:hypothetical protein